MGNFTKEDALKRRGKRLELASMKRQEEERKSYIERCKNFDFCPKCKGYGVLNESDLEGQEKECDRCEGSGFYYTPIRSEEE